MSFLKGLRFLKRIPILKGLAFNLSKSGIGLSLGRRGLRFGRTAGGKLYLWIGVPGTGLGYRRYIEPERLIALVLAWFGSRTEPTTAQRRAPRPSGYLRRFESELRSPGFRRAVERARRILREEHERKRREYYEQHGPSAAGSTDPGEPTS